MPLPSDHTNLTVPVLTERHEYIRARAARINMSVAKFFEPWVAQWFEQGMPNLHELEKLLPPLPLKDLEKHPSSSEKTGKGRSKS